MTDSHPTYELLYHPTIPGRGEFIRLAFEATGTPYVDVANSVKDGYATVQSLCAADTTLLEDDNLPLFAPPALRVTPEIPTRLNGDESKILILHQTPAILMFLGPRLNLAGSEESDPYRVHQIALTALDLNNEAHDTHHPVAVGAYYENQKAEALRKATDFRATRIPKYLSYFSRVLQANAQSRGQSTPPYLVGETLTYADTTVWQVLDGLYFAFPNEMAARRAEFPELFEKFYEGLKERKWLREYLGSERRLAYSMGVFRHYPELDRQ